MTTYDIDIILKSDDFIQVQIFLNDEIKYKKEYSKETQIKKLYEDYLLEVREGFPAEIKDILKSQRGKDVTNDEELLLNYANGYEEENSALSKFTNLNIPDIIGKPFDNPFTVYTYVKKDKALKTLKFDGNDKVEELKDYGPFSAYCNGNNKLFISGGQKDQGEYVEKFWIIDLVSTEIESNNMIAKKNHSMILIPGNYVFIVGGQTKGTFYYDLENNKFHGWKKLNNKRTEPALILVNDYLYCFDNMNSKSNENFSFERTKLLDSIEHNWEKIEPIMPLTKMTQKYFGVARNNDDIIFIGGSLDLEGEKDKITERKNFKYNITENKIEESDINYINYNFNEKSFLKYNDKISYILPDFNRVHPEVMFYQHEKNAIKFLKLQSRKILEERKREKEEKNARDNSPFKKGFKLNLNQPIIANFIEGIININNKTEDIKNINENVEKDNEEKKDDNMQNENEEKKDDNIQNENEEKKNEFEQNDNQFDQNNNQFGQNNNQFDQNNNQFQQDNNQFDQNNNQFQQDNNQFEENDNQNIQNNNEPTKNAEYNPYESNNNNNFDFNNNNNIDNDNNNINQLSNKDENPEINNIEGDEHEQKEQSEKKSNKENENQFKEEDGYYELNNELNNDVNTNDLVLLDDILKKSQPNNQENVEIKVEGDKNQEQDINLRDNNKNISFNPELDDPNMNNNGINGNEGIQTSNVNNEPQINENNQQTNIENKQETNFENNQQTNLENNQQTNIENNQQTNIENNQQTNIENKQENDLVQPNLNNQQQQQQNNGEMVPLPGDNVQYDYWVENIIVGINDDPGKYADVQLKNYSSYPPDNNMNNNNENIPNSNTNMQNDQYNNQQPNSNTNMQNEQYNNQQPNSNVNMQNEQNNNQQPNTYTNMPNDQYNNQQQPINNEANNNNQQDNNIQQPNNENNFNQQNNNIQQPNNENNLNQQDNNIQQQNNENNMNQPTTNEIPPNNNQNTQVPNAEGNIDLDEKGEYCICSMIIGANENNQEIIQYYNKNYYDNEQRRAQIRASANNPQPNNDNINNNNQNNQMQQYPGDNNMVVNNPNEPGTNYNMNNAEMNQQNQQNPQNQQNQVYGNETGYNNNNNINNNNEIQENPTTNNVNPGNNYNGSNNINLPLIDITDPNLGGNYKGDLKANLPNDNNSQLQPVKIETDRNPNAMEQYYDAQGNFCMTGTILSKNDQNINNDIENANRSNLLLLNSNKLDTHDNQQQNDTNLNNNTQLNNELNNQNN